jgi:hypothetical protein
MAQVLIIKRRVNVWDLRRLFNEGKYIDKFTRDELTARSVRCKPVDLNSPLIGKTIPKGSISQTLHLLDENEDFIAEYQRFIRPEGTIGASGFNDPKRMLIGNVRFHQEQPGNPQPRLTCTEINSILDKRGLRALWTYVLAIYYWLTPPPNP